jgi:hypothetical protein
MRRAAARFGLLAFLAGVPAALRSVLGPPGLPSFGPSGGLSDTYLPAEGVLEVLGLLAWALWTYLAVALLLHSAVVVVSFRGGRPHRLLAISSLLAPKTLRHLVEFAVGGTLLAASFSTRVAASIPLAAPAPVATSAEMVPAASNPVGAPERRAKDAYRVRVGDSLWRIAERELGSGFRWREIYGLNEGKCFPDGRCLTDPHLIHPGWVLELPAAEDGRRDRVEKDRPDGRERPRPSVTATPTAVPDSAASPLPRQSPAPAESEEDDPPEISEDTQSGPSTEPVLHLPSGVVVAASFASGLLTAHLIGRLHRRRARRLSAPEPAEPEEPLMVHDMRRAGAAPMVGQLDVALEAAVEAWRGKTGVWPRLLLALQGQRVVRIVIGDAETALPAASGGSVSPHVRFARVEGTVHAEVTGPFPPRLRPRLSPLERGLLVPIGRTRDGAAVHVGAAWTGTVSLTGPAAPSLARQMILAAAVQATPEDLKVVLLGAGEKLGIERLPQVAGAYGWEEGPNRLRDIQIELLRRARLLFEEGVDDLESHLAGHPDDRLPALLIVAGEPPQSLGGLVEAVGGEGRGLGAALLALGWQPQTAALHVRAGPYLVEIETDLPCPNVVEPFLLDEQAAEAATNVMRAAYPEGVRETQEAGVQDSSEDAGGSAEAESTVAGEPPLIEPSPSIPAVMPATGEAARGEVTLLPGEETPAPPPDLPVVRCLGPLRISRGERSLRKGWRTKARELLAYLVAHPNGAPKERVVEELFPEIEPRLGESEFDRLASNVRKQVRGPDDSGKYIEKVGESYRLEKRPGGSTPGNSSDS